MLQVSPFVALQQSEPAYFVLSPVGGETPRRTWQFIFFSMETCSGSAS